ncbi:immunoglobulin superfamily containing leucine-rich repeat protein 2-like [Lates japonicus]
MAAADILFFTLWIATFFATGLGCPVLCTCLDKHNRHVAECSYKDIAEVPDGFPPNVSTVSLTVNKISFIPLGSFDNVTQVTSLWMSHNEIVSIEQGTLAPLVHLRNFDVSYNKIVDFPWEDLQSLTALHLLKMNHNEMAHLPRDAFSNLKELRSLRLHNNKFVTIAEGTFDGLLSLSYLQISNNPFACTCSLDWLRDWISASTKIQITVPDQNLITCASPDTLKGEEISTLPESKCMSPNVTIQTEPNIHNSSVYEDSTLILTCEFKGNPKPLIMWNIRSKSQTQELALSFAEDDSTESNENSLQSSHPVKVFSNGTLIISHLRKEDSGNYSCLATNEFGRADDSVSVEVVASPKPTPITRMTTTPTYTETQSYVQRATNKISVFDSVRRPNIRRENLINIVPTVPPTAEINSESYEEETRYPLRASKCGLTANTRYISSHVFNGSLEDIKQYTFDFGVIALGVSETEVTVRLNPLLVPREKIAAGDTTATTSGSVHTDSEERHELSDDSEKVHSNGLYLCVTADHKHSAVQWSRIKEGVNTYVFSGLRPGTNYSLCLTYRGEDCEVQVLFTTRRRVPNLLIIISVSICLLTVSTVPLLGATCFHLVYKYRSKTYKLILKAKDQYHMERNLTANFNIHAPHTDSRRRINGSQLDEEEGETESGDGEKEADTEESVVTESFTLSQCRGNLDDCEVGSEYSDRLPLGAEAVNITSNYKYQ